MTIGHTTVTILFFVVGLEEKKEYGVDNTINEDAVLFRMEDNWNVCPDPYLQIYMLNIRFVMNLQLGEVLKYTNRREEGMQSDL